MIGFYFIRIIIIIVIVFVKKCMPPYVVPVHLVWLAGPGINSRCLMAVLGRPILSKLVVN